MARSTVLTAVGDDRPGLVEEISRFLLERGGSIEESRMVNLHGRFAVATLVTGSDDAIARITGEIDVLAARTGIAARLSPVDHPRQAPPPERTYRFVARAVDRPGLVHEVADVLRRHGANVETLDTSLEPAPMTGAPIFAMEIVVALAPGTEVADVERELEIACAPFGLDWTLTAVG